ncbi:MAG: cell division protein FtsL [Niveispirillum sp.]|uniref:cell division protein FtsL n=1 Tax=Niveispirillum sp. TaxID=1917217 RepID=UPI003BA6DF46
MIGKSTIVWIAVSCAASGILYQTSYKAQEQERELSRLNRAIVAEQEAIQVLKAEWAYLNDPTRLEKLSAEHLLLQATSAAQIATLAGLPAKDPNQPAPFTPIPGRKPGSRAPEVIERAPMPKMTPVPPAPSRRQPEGPVILAKYGATR